MAAIPGRTTTVTLARVRSTDTGAERDRLEEAGVENVVARRIRRRRGKLCYILGPWVFFNVYI